MIDNLPTLSGQFQCAFSAFGKTLLTNATRTANGVSCTTPRTDHIPANPPGQRERFVFFFLLLPVAFFTLDGLIVRFPLGFTFSSSFIFFFRLMSVEPWLLPLQLLPPSLTPHLNRKSRLSLSCELHTCLLSLASHPSIHPSHHPLPLLQ